MASFCIFFHSAWEILIPRYAQTCACTQRGIYVCVQQAAANSHSRVSQLPERGDLGPKVSRGHMWKTESCSVLQQEGMGTLRRAWAAPLDLFSGKICRGTASTLQKWEQCYWDLVSASHSACVSLKCFSHLLCPKGTCMAHPAAACCRISCSPAPWARPSCSSWSVIHKQTVSVRRSAGVGRRLQHYGIHTFDQCLVWKEACQQSGGGATSFPPPPEWPHLLCDPVCMHTPGKWANWLPLELQGLVTKDFKIFTTT